MAGLLTKFAFAGAAVLFAAWVVMANARRVRAALDAVATIPRWRLAAFTLFLAVATLSAQKKGGNANVQPRGEMPQRTDLRNVGNSLRDGGSESITNFNFTAISVSSNVVTLSLAWPANLFDDGACLDIFAKVGSLSNSWEWIGCMEIDPSSTNINASVSLAELPGTTNLPASAFFLASDRATAAATMRDSDGDGIPDIYELNNGTNPYIPDATQAPRLMVGDGGYATVEDALEDSVAYSIIELPPGEYELYDSLLMPEHPVMITGPACGYAVLHSDANVAVVMLDGGQGSETLFRNIILALEHKGNYQAGFWVGGNLPWNGLGASPTFDNVRIRAPYPDTLYYGWHYYRNNGGTSVVSRCTMNAAGAESVIGVYSYGGQTVKVSDCHFVNFPMTNGNYATYFQSGTNIVAEYALPEIELSWAGYPLDGEYSAFDDSDEDGLSDYDEIFMYDTDPWLADSDCDGVPDGNEVDDGTEPHDSNSHLLHVVAIVTEVDLHATITNYVGWGETRNGPLTNELVAAVGASTNHFVFAGTNAAVYVGAFWDFNRDGAYTPETDDMVYGRASWEDGFNTVRLHLTAVGDSDGDGIPNWWEHFHANAGLSNTNATDAYFDPDEDGLVNLHEYWADCDPLVADGSNTVLAIMSKSVNSRLTPDSNGRIDKFKSGRYGMELNTNCWAYSIDTSCASHKNSFQGSFRAGTAITRRHVVLAAHYPLAPGHTLNFFGVDGNEHSRTVVSTNRVLDSDILICLLNEDLPSAVHPAKLLPKNFRSYIGSGRGLPGLMFDYSEHAIVSEFDSLPEFRGNVNGRVPVDNVRAGYFEEVVVGDSGDPKFLIINNEPILVCTIQSAGAGGSGNGPFLTSWADDIQSVIDAMSDEAGIERIPLQYHDFNGYEQIFE